jgi:hypothetical protein
MGASQLGGASIALILDCFLSQGVEPIGLLVPLQLPVPSFGIELLEPLPKGRKIGRGKIAHCGLNFRHGIHM